MARYGLSTESYDAQAHQPPSLPELRKCTSSKGKTESKMTAKIDGKTGFLDLPPEIRNMIYKLHWGSTTLAHVGNANCAPRKTRWSPHRDNLALLRSCKTVHAETEVLWANDVMFKFSTVRQMLQALWPISVQKRREIKHVQVSPAQLKLNFTKFYYTLGQCMDCLTDLKLTTLYIDFYDRKLARSDKTNVDDVFERAEHWQNLIIRCPVSALTKHHSPTYPSNGTLTRWKHRLGLRTTEAMEDLFHLYVGHDKVAEDQIWDPTARTSVPADVSVIWDTVPGTEYTAYNSRAALLFVNPGTAITKTPTGSDLRWRDFPMCMRLRNFSSQSSCMTWSDLTWTHILAAEKEWSERRGKKEEPIKTEVAPVNAPQASHSGETPVTQ